MPTTLVGPSSAASCRVRWISAAFGHVVDAEAELGPHAADRSDVDDHARRLVERTLATPAWDQNSGPAQVDVERLVVRARVDVERGAEVRVGGGVVDEDVEPAEVLERGVDAGRGRVEVAGVGGEDGRLAVDLGRCRLELVLLAAAQHHLRAGRGEPGGDRLADALRRARDERDLALEGDLHRPDGNACLARARLAASSSGSAVRGQAA